LGRLVPEEVTQLFDNLIEDLVM